MAASKPKYSLGSPQEHIEMCKTHELPIDVICEDCNEFICGKCAKTDHRDHEWSTIPTAASQRRRDLLSFMKKIKEEDLPGIDEKIEMVSQQMTGNEELCETEIKKLQKHYDEIITRLTEIKKRNEQRSRDHLKDKNDKLESLKSELESKKKEIAETVQFMEENQSSMSDYGLLDNHRELTQLLSGLVVDIEDCKHSVRYSQGEISEWVLEKIMGKTLDLDDVKLIETSSFKNGDQRIVLLRALSEDQCYLRQFEIPYTVQVNKKGDIKHKYNITAYVMCVTAAGNVYFTDGINNAISCLSPPGYVSTVIRTDPLVPMGMCQSVDGGLMVTLRDMKSDHFKLESQSRRLVKHITLTGDAIHEYEYQEDGQTRLFTFPIKVIQNSNSDICVVNFTADTISNLVILSSSGHLKYVYRGQNKAENFNPFDVVCDSLCNILVTDRAGKNIHLPSPDGEFLKFLLSEKEENGPARLSLYKSTLWVGYYDGLVKVFWYRV